jgi:hypothetical protein
MNMIRLIIYRNLRRFILLIFGIVLLFLLGSNLASVNASPLSDVSSVSVIESPHVTSEDGEFTIFFKAYIYDNGEVRFIAESEGKSPAMWAWNMGDGTTYVGKDISHYYQPGEYTVELTGSSVEHHNLVTSMLITVPGETESTENIEGSASKEPDGEESDSEEPDRGGSDSGEPDGRELGTGDLRVYVTTTTEVNEIATIRAELLRNSEQPSDTVPSAPQSDVSSSELSLFHTKTVTVYTFMEAKLHGNFDDFIEVAHPSTDTVNFQENEIAIWEWKLQPSQSAVGVHHFDLIISSLDTSTLEQEAVTIPLEIQVSSASPPMNWVLLSTEAFVGLAVATAGIWLLRNRRINQKLTPVSIKIPFPTESSDSIVAKTIFISYSRYDWTEYVKPLFDKLEKDDFAVWIDQGSIYGGDDFMDRINEGLKTCEIMILCVSPEAIASDRVKIEYRDFLSDRKPVIPLLLRPTSMPPELKGIHYIKYGNYEALIAALRELENRLKYRSPEYR